MNFFKKFFKTNENNNYHFVLPRNYSPQNNLSSELKPLNNLDANVFEDLKSNLEYIKVKYNFLINPKNVQLTIAYRLATKAREPWLDVNLTFLRALAFVSHLLFDYIQIISNNL